ncbi:hypothetical protein TNCV_1432641 [Trichonephila clavipes]|nr:hypothetical protein TNCV_1432641 [Trichonephila clavipes]
MRRRLNRDSRSDGTERKTQLDREKRAETGNRGRSEVPSGSSWRKGKVENECRWRCRNYPAHLIEIWASVLRTKQ